MLCTSPRLTDGILAAFGGVRRPEGFDEVFSLAVGSKVLMVIGVE